MSANTDVIDQFVAAWAELDVDKIMRFFTDDAVYTNIPMDPPNVGTAMIRQTLEGFMGMAEGIEFVVHNQGESEAGGVVFNERTDRFLIKGEWAEGRVMGVFEMEGGKIKAWRDYFDLAEFMAVLSAG
jgi:limonene-1,2-epoxide hydrolase